jgi:hypothetical protein
LCFPPQGEQEYAVDSGILTFINHGCNGTFNIGTKSEVNEFNANLDEPIPKEYSSSHGVYNPAVDRTLHIDEFAIINSKEVKAGSEVLDNYLSMGGEMEFKTYALELRQECSGVLGLVEEYQKNATMHRERQKNASVSPRSATTIAQRIYHSVTNP